MRILFALLLACLSIGACGKNVGHAEISGKTPAEGSAIAADVVCDQQVVCGSPSLVCSTGSSASGGTGTICMGTLNPVSYADCFADVQPDIEHLLSCPGLTPTQVDMIEACVNALATSPCVTQAQLDEWARQTETGTSVSSPQPAACEFLSTLIPTCG